MLTNQQLLALALCLTLCVNGNDAGTLPGLEIKQAKNCGLLYPNFFSDPHDETAKIEIYPWPFIPSRKRYNISLTFTPAVDVFAATLEAELIDVHVVQRFRYYLCPRFPELCSLPAGETRVFTDSGIMPPFPPGFKMTFKVVAKVYNEDHIMFGCLEVVATTH